MKIDGHNFPDVGKIEHGVCRFSAKDIMGKLGAGWIPHINLEQLVLGNPLAINASIHVYTSVKIGQLAGPVGTDSIRVVLNTGASYQKHDSWTTRTFPYRITDYQEALDWVAEKIRKKVEKLIRSTRPCPDCGGLQVKLKSNTKANPGREFWKCGSACGETWKGWADGKTSHDLTRPCPDCGLEQIRLISRSAKNPGRKYWKCNSCPDKRQWKGWDDKTSPTAWRQITQERKRARQEIVNTLAMRIDQLTAAATHSKWKPWPGQAASARPPMTISEIAATSMARVASKAKIKIEEPNMDSGIWVQKWNVHSASSGKTYIIGKHADGYYGCSCPAWTFKKGPPGQRPHCKHITEFLLNHPGYPIAPEAIEAPSEDDKWGWF
jgi:hypothetical protein